MGASWGYAYQPVVSQPVAPRWVDDPWSAMTTGEAEAWRAGWEAAKAQATRLAGQVPIPEDCAAIEAHGRLSAAMDAAHAISAMDPPALPWWLVAIGYLTCAGSLGICAATAVLVVFR